MQPDLSRQPFYLCVQRSLAASSANSSAGLLGRLGFSAASIDIELDTSVVYLCPSPGTDDAADAEVKGKVVLHLPKPRTVSGLSVRLWGQYSLQWPEGQVSDSGVLFERTAMLLGDEEKVELPVGSHIFEFSLSVPMSAAPTEGSTYGRIRHYLTARVAHLGTLGGDLLSERLPVYFIANPLVDGVPMPTPSFQAHVEEAEADKTGPWALDLRSQHSTIGGLLLFRLVFYAPPTTLRIHSVKLNILQHSVLQPPNQPGALVAPPPAPHIISILDSSSPPSGATLVEDGRGASRRDLSSREPLAVGNGQPLELLHLARIPNVQHRLRASTMEGVDTPLALRHTVEVDVLYWEEEEQAGRSGKGKRQKPELLRLKVIKSIQLFSCLNLLDSLRLPSYSAKDTSTLSVDGPLDIKVPCICTLSADELLAKHADLLLDLEPVQGRTTDLVAEAIRAKR